jgi:hypothetical protein
MGGDLLAGCGGRRRRLGGVAAGRGRPGQAWQRLPRPWQLLPTVQLFLDEKRRRRLPAVLAGAEARVRIVAQRREERDRKRRAETDAAERDLARLCSVIRGAQRRAPAGEGASRLLRSALVV